MNKRLRKAARWWSVEWRKWQAWLRSHEGLWAAALFGAGVFALGFALASIEGEVLRTAQSKRHNVAIQQIATAYRDALASKDQTIKTLSARTAQAATNAGNAAVAAASAAESAASTADAVCVDPKAKKP